MLSMLNLHNELHFFIQVACRRNEEFAVDAYRCDETCEKYGDPICRDLSPEGRCYCKDSFIRLKSIGICVDVNNRACLAKMPTTNGINLSD